MNLPDAYVLRARVAPVVIISLPFLIKFAHALISSNQLPTIVATGIIGLAIITLLAQLGRDRGKKLEPMLFQTWGGKPTTAILRHRDTRLDTVTKSRLHGWLNQRIDGLHLPDALVELDDPVEADKQYDSAVYWLRSKTADNQRFARLHEENVSYGFRRNLLGLKPLGIIFSILLIFADLVVNQPLTVDKTIDFLSQPSIAVALFLAVFLIFFVTESWVRNSAEAYAFALFNTVESLSS
ncbi:MAG: hypothetical protein AAFY20_00640 [Cyanobacteria bacterium J06639_14]